MTSDGWTEPGRSVDESGQIIYAWPPEGRFADLWRRFADTFSDEVERSELISLLARWRDENDTLVAYTDDDGEWVDVEPDWDVPLGWLE